MCENALARDRDKINVSQKCLLVREVCKADSILPGSRKILLAAFSDFCVFAARVISGIVMCWNRAVSRRGTNGPSSINLLEFIKYFLPMVLRRELVPVL
jgi:hypothetical protein